jgi:hypothetical protein
MNIPEIERTNLKLFRRLNGEVCGLELSLHNFSINSRRNLISAQFDNSHLHPRKISLYLPEKDQEIHFSQDDIDIANYYDPLRYQMFDAADEASELLLTKDPQRMYSLTNPTFDEAKRVVHRLTTLPLTEITIVSFGNSIPKRSTFRPSIFARNNMQHILGEVVEQAAGNQKLVFINHI